MGCTENKAAAIELYTRILPGDHAGPLAAHLAPGFRDHDPLHAGTDGAEGLTATMHWISNAFSDQDVVLRHVVAEDDTVVLHLGFTATHTGYFRGVAPTGQRFTVDEMHLLRFEEGLVAEHWAVRDDVYLDRALHAPHGHRPTYA